MSRATDEKHELIARRHKARQYALQCVKRPFQQAIDNKRMPAPGHNGETAIG